MAEGGPVPHRRQDGKVVTFRPKSPTATEVASGASLLVDVEFCRGRSLYALSQGGLFGQSSGFSSAAEHRRTRGGPTGR